MPVVPVILDMGPSREHTGKALIRHIELKSPNPMPTRWTLQFSHGVRSTHRRKARGAEGTSRTSRSESGEVRKRVTDGMMTVVLRLIASVGGYMSQ